MTHTHGLYLMSQICMSNRPGESWRILTGRLFRNNLYPLYPNPSVPNSPSRLIRALWTLRCSEHQVLVRCGDGRLVLTGPITAVVLVIPCLIWDNRPCKDTLFHIQNLSNILNLVFKLMLTQHFYRPIRKPMSLKPT